MLASTVFAPWKNALEVPGRTAIARPYSRRKLTRARQPRTHRSLNGITCTAVLLVAGVTAGGAFIAVHGSTQHSEYADRRVSGGSVMVVGGGSVTPDIRQRFIEMAGGSQARIVLIPGTDPSPEGEQQLLSPWRKCGIASVVLCNARDRAMANDPAFCLPLKEATGVWFGGGYQSMLSERYVDTAVQKCLHDVLGRNGVVGGCSAGAALLSRVMIREGDTTPVESRGLDLVSRAVIDQHFLARNRLWRLEQMLEVHPDLIGLGVDEATALVIELQDWKLTVVGESYVVTCLAQSGSHARRIEILKPGDEVTLSNLYEQHLAYVAPAE